jgi:hypothetical protein
MFLFELDSEGHPVKTSPRGFVNYWKELYDEKKYPTEVLERNLNIGGQLRDHSVKPLLEWKLAFIQPKAERDNLVEALAPKILNSLDKFNEFRSLEHVTEKEFTPFWNFCVGLAEEVGRRYVIGAYLLFISHPEKYPMADQHVLTSWHFIEQGKVDGPNLNLETYRAYRDFFLGFCALSQGKLRSRLTWGNVREVDKALWTFGKHLNRPRSQP